MMHRASPRRPRLPALAAAAAAIALLVPAVAAAHIEITSHVDRFGKDQQKTGPCGGAAAGPGPSVYTYEPGEVVSVAWHEFVDHPGHYRVAFDADGEDDFLDPVSADDRYNNAAVLAEIDDESGVHNYEFDVTFPDVECEVCTIQVIQVMTDKAPFGDGNDLYFHCIDVRLRVGGGPNTTEADGPVGCRCAAGDEGGPAGAGWMIAALLALGLRRRRA